MSSLATQVTNLAISRPWDNEFKDRRTKSDEVFKSFVTRLDELLRQIPYQKRINKILKSLYFQQIKERVSEIQEAHENTFGWSFGEHPRANIEAWMKSKDSDSLYWVCGNAGSGKSTMMKFLLSDSRTTDALNEWAAPRRLIIASHFFWSTGTPIQKSQEGLFRSLLFEVMMKQVDLIKVVCPDRWRGESQDLEPWSRAELFESFKKLACQQDYPYSFCLFIDGLDEYQGDHRDLIKIVYDISKSSHFKICASSRPWIEFRQAFERSTWKLYLQDLTEPDIRHYVKDSLCRPQPMFAWIECHDVELANTLAEQICKKAQGVFLWVYLVVRSLLRGLANGDDLRDLQRRVDELPSDLEDYFKLMLDNIDAVYRHRTARIFQSLVHSDMPLPIIVFYFFDLEDSDPDYATKGRVWPTTDSQVLAIVKPKRYQIIVQCRDLVKLSANISEPAIMRDNVNFLHRTVADFFRTHTMSELLSSRAGCGFEPRASLSTAFLAMIKSVPQSWISRNITSLERVRRLCLGIISYAQALECIHQPLRSSVLGELHLTLTALLSPSKWEELFPDTSCRSVIHLYARCGLVHYLRQAIPKLPVAERAELKQQLLKPRILIVLEQGFTFELGHEADKDTAQQLLCML
jgi:hypothetical protein